MEQLLHYIWKHRILPLCGLHTQDGREVEIIDPGLHNIHAGPDFFNAKLRIGGVMWVGNVEIHERSADWFMHGHDQDPLYNNVVLHVASVIDAEVVTEDGQRPPQLQLSVPSCVLQNYRRLLAADRYPPCRETVEKMPRLAVHSWMSALVAERMNVKGEAVVKRVAASGGSWENAFFITLGRSFGFGVNSEAFEQWAAALPVMQAAHHRDDPFQIEAMFMGVAGLLDPDQMKPRQREAALADGYFAGLVREYAYLSRKFSLHAIPRQAWRFLRLRPQNFPYIRLSQLARLYCSRRADLSRVVQCKTMDELRCTLDTDVGDYWRTHYTPGSESPAADKRLSRQSVDLLVVNAVVPVLHAYGLHRSDDGLMARAMAFLESLAPEDNSVVRMWSECGVTAENAADTQAIMQLQQHYCERRDCLRCRFGYYSLKQCGG